MQVEWCDWMLPLTKTENNRISHLFKPICDEFMLQNELHLNNHM